MKHLDLTKKYCEFLEEFHQVERIPFDPTKTEISEAIFYHVFKVKQSLWKQSIDFNRAKRIAISDLLQDIIAYYLKAVLPAGFNVLLEVKKDRLQPDILIQFEERNLFIIEVKTTIGWNRSLIKDGGIENRMQALADCFEIPIANVVYIFQCPWNVDLAFTQRYLDIKNAVPVHGEQEFPFNQVRPLLNREDPYYDWNEHDRRRMFYLHSDEAILERAKVNIVVPIEKTIAEIITAAETWNTALVQAATAY